MPKNQTSDNLEILRIVNVHFPVKKSFIIKEYGLKLYLNSFVYPYYRASLNKVYKAINKNLRRKIGFFIPRKNVD